MSDSTLPDPAERRTLMRLFYRDWRPTRVGRWVNRLQGWWSGLGLPPRFMAALEVRGRVSGHRRSTAVVIAAVDGQHYLVSMLGPGSDWVQNVAAAHGEAVLRQGRRRRCTSCWCRQSSGHRSSASTCASPRAAVSTSRSPSARRWPSSRRSPSGIRCTGLIPPQATPHHCRFDAGVLRGIPPLLLAPETGTG